MKLRATAANDQRSSRDSPNVFYGDTGVIDPDFKSLGNESFTDKNNDDGKIRSWSIIDNPG